MTMRVTVRSFQSRLAMHLGGVGRPKFMGFLLLAVRVAGRRLVCPGMSGAGNVYWMNWRSGNIFVWVKVASVV